MSEMTEGDIELPVFFDANVWIRAWDRYYVQGVFPMLWDKLEEAVKVRQLMIPYKIGEELVKKVNGLDEFI